MNYNEIFSKDNSIYETWRLCNADNPDLPAVEYFGKQWTFGEVDEMIDVYAHAFMSLLPDRSKSVTFCVPTLPSMIFAFYALNKIGVRANFISDAILKSDASKYLDDTDSEILFILDKFYSNVATEVNKTKVKTIIVVSLMNDVGDLSKLIQQIKLSNPDLKRVPKFLIKNKMKSAFSKIKAKYAVCGKEIINLSEFISFSENNTTPVEQRFTPNETAVVLYTGGSTGIPKGVEKTNEEFLAMARIYVKMNFFNLKAGARKLVLIPPNHPTSFVHSIILPWVSGKTLVLQPIYSKLTFAYDLFNLKPQILIAAPSHYATLPKCSLPDGALSHLKVAFCGGEAVSLELANSVNNALERLGAQRPCIISCYGMSELGPLTHNSFFMSTPLNKVGSPIPEVVARIVDDSGNILGDNIRGNLEIKTPCRMKGYFKQPELTKVFFTDDGFAITGDIAVRDEDGNYDVLGRATDLIVAPDGTKVYLFDIERIVYKDSAVLECEVIGLEVGGKKVPVVHIILNPEYIEKDEEVIPRIHKLCQEHLTKNEMPQGYKIRETFATNQISAKRDIASLALERDGYFAVENGVLRAVSF